ncbi:NADase-type glycan-binding domain-containing protein [Amycolatopsis taiwanensis]|uniref:F5/8 type C domain-containing protein n=1 Tax=Amycolatopsis taiwanensis TaxID=342230 RepID=A0A9W6R3Y1_9PSEU|nr:hypothetical protein [Amycolatopsis taiwanensis]GLY69056.1 hypothetical protein Atai01_56750 [Amycolatopsis taiwanensis]
MNGDQRVICAQCGEHNAEGDTFCGGCGAFLEWETARPTPLAEPAPDESALSSQTTESQTPKSPAQQRPAPAPVAEPSPPAEPEVRLRRPGSTAPPPRRSTTRPAEPNPEDGSLDCPRCQAGNRPERTFCRACGARLATPPAPVKQPWWHRLFSRRPAPAGHRNRTRRRIRLAPLIMAILILLALVAGFPLRGKVTEVVDAIRDRIGQPTPIVAAATASSEAPGHGAGLAVDGTRNTYWAPAGTGAAEGEFLEFSFSGPVRLTSVLISPGAGGTQPEFRDQARPKGIRLSWTTDSGTGQQETELAEGPQPQQIDLGVSGVRSLRLTLLSGYGIADGKRIAIGEVEFFGRT